MVLAVTGIYFDSLGVSNDHLPDTGLRDWKSRREDDVSESKIAKPIPIAASPNKV
jgi:hypothetical protein